MVFSRGTQLHNACLNGDLATVERLLDDQEVLEPEAETNDNAIRDGLFQASSEGFAHVAAFLLGKGAAVDATTSDGMTPLMSAALSGRTQVVKLLLSKGAEVDKNRPDGYNALLLACEAGWVESVRALLQHGASVELTNTEGWTAVMLAAEFGHDQVLGLLLDKNPRVDARRSNKCTALYIASQHGHAEAARMLLQHGASVDMTDEKGWTPLMAAAWMNCPEVVISESLTVQQRYISRRNMDMWPQFGSCWTVGQPSTCRRKTTGRHSWAVSKEDAPK